jgi:hypothetical protein
MEQGKVRHSTLILTLDGLQSQISNLLTFLLKDRAMEVRVRLSESV